MKLFPSITRTAPRIGNIQQAITIVLFMTTTSLTQATATNADEQIVADLDTKYQKAVEQNDGETMNQILADDFILVTGLGKVLTKADLLLEAREGETVYKTQSDSKRTVRVWGDTAVVTALLWAKGTEKGRSFEYHLWFSDTYVRTQNGWRYVFAQASTRLAEPSGT